MLAVNVKYDLRLMPVVHELIAAVVILALAIYLPLRLILLRSRRKLWVASTGLALLLVAGLYCARALMAHGALPMVSFIAEAHMRGLAAPATQPAVPSAQAKRPTTAPAVAAIPPSESDDYAPLLAAARDALNKVRRQPDAIRAELTAAGVPRLLSAATLASPKRIAAGRARIKRLYTRLDQYEALVHDTITDVAAKAQATDAPTSVQMAFLRQFNPTGARATGAVSDFIAFERRSLGQIDALLVFAQSKAGHYTVTRKGITFSSPADRQTYAVLLRDVTTSTAREAQLLRPFRQQGDLAMHNLTTALDAQASAAD
jgi:hypothetical protein